MPIGLLWAQWLGFSLSVGLYGLLVLFPGLPIPDELRRFYKYGKAAQSHRKSTFTTLDLPKRYVISKCTVPLKARAHRKVWKSSEEV